MERKELLKLLELDENAGQNEIEDAFYILTMRAKNDDTIELDKVTEAYIQLTHKEKRTEEQIKAGKRKVNRRLFMIGTMLVLSVIAIILFFYAIRAKDDVNVYFMGYYYHADIEVLGSYIEDSGLTKSAYISTIDITGPDSLLLSKDMNGNILFFNQFEKMTMDIFILDDFTYGYFKDKDILIDLSDYLDEIGISKDDERLIRYDGKVIAIDFSENTLLKSMFVRQYKMYLAIGRRNHGIPICIDTVKLILE
ncbi:MAG: hypothetical protein JXQ23_12420 [Clostridia bacterium]|nr:hypothetical protein [Clostridia bacterium]